MHVRLKGSMMICMLFGVFLLLNSSLGEVQQCDECCVPNVSRYGGCYRNCTLKCAGLPVLSFEESDIQLDESSGGLEVCMIRSGRTDLLSSVSIMTSEGSATSPEDYAAINTQLIFEPGSTNKQCVTLEFVVDGSTETDEYFHMVASDPVGATVTEDLLRIVIIDV